MNILCLHPFLSMRAVKEMRALKALGHNVTLVYEGLGCSVEKGFGDFWDQIIQIPGNTFKGEYFFRRLIPRSYQRVLIELTRDQHFDIIHAFSMPDTLAVAAIRYSGLPVVYDSRDVSSGMDKVLLEDLKNSLLNKLQSYFYQKIIKKYEREANEKSSARIYVSKEMQTYISKVYNINQKKAIVLPNYQSAFFLPGKSIPKILDSEGSKHLVYIGNILFDDYQRTIEILENIAKYSVHLHIYPVGKKTITKRIKKLFRYNHYIHFHNPLPPKDLLEELQQYDFGLVPRPPDRNTINFGFALPNKLFDYLAAGLPIAARNTRSVSNFIKENKVGIIYDDVRDLVSKIMNSSNSFKFDKKKFVMENHIAKVINLYISISSSI